MGLFGNEFRNVVEWQESDDTVIFHKWHNDEIKKGSRLIIRAGQDAIFMYNGKIEGIFKDEGSFDIESDIIPFLSTLKGFKFGFNSGVRAEVLFVNTKEFTVKWGTKNPIAIPAPSLPGGMPIRAFGTFNIKVDDYLALIDKVAGVKQMYTVDDVRERVVAVLDQLLMKWISKEGKDMFHLQASAYDIGKGMQEDLDMELLKMGMTVTGVQISSFSYPQESGKNQCCGRLSDGRGYEPLPAGQTGRWSGSARRRCRQYSRHGLWYGSRYADGTADDAKHAAADTAGSPAASRRKALSFLWCGSTGWR